MTLRVACVRINWESFTQEWRNSYYEFTSAGAKCKVDESSRFKIVDDHHYHSLYTLIAQHNIEDLWTDNEVYLISRIWHYLEGWPDSIIGLQALKDRGFLVCTLSNGNSRWVSLLCLCFVCTFCVVMHVLIRFGPFLFFIMVNTEVKILSSLLTDLSAFANLPWSDIYSAEMVRIPIVRSLSPQVTIRTCGRNIPVVSRQDTIEGKSALTKKTTYSLESTSRILPSTKAHVPS